MESLDAASSLRVFINLIEVGFHDQNNYTGARSCALPSREPPDGVTIKGIVLV